LALETVASGLKATFDIHPAVRAEDGGIEGHPGLVRSQ
jgi:hypothetical protein